MTLAAQAPSPTQAAGTTGSGQVQKRSPSVYVIPVPAGLDCPVSMHAQQQSGIGTLTARDDRGEPARAAKSRAKSGEKEIKRAEIGNWRGSCKI